MAVRDDFSAGEVLAAADLNDTFASKLPYSYGTATPSTSDSGFLWYDSNSTPPVPKYWNGSAFANLVTNKIIQVVSTAKTDTFTTTSTSFADITGLSVTITPSSASNSVLVLAMVTGANESTVATFHLRLMRDSTPIAIGNSAGSRRQGTSSLTIGDSDPNMVTSAITSWLDAPNTTSAVTYKMQGAVNAGSGYINRSDNDGNNTVTSRMVSTITVFEVGA